MSDMDYTSSLASLRARLEGQMQPKLLRERLHPYTLEASLLDRDAASKEVAARAGSALRMSDKWISAAPEKAVHDIQMHAFAQLHRITYEAAEATYDAASLLRRPLSECDPHDAAFRLYRRFVLLHRRYSELSAYRSPRAKRLLRLLGRRLGMIPAGHLAENLLAPFAFWVAVEATKTSNPAHSRAHSDDPNIARAKKVACEYYLLSKLGNISDSNPSRTVCEIFRMKVRETFKNWRQQLVVVGHFTPAERVFNLRPDPLSCLKNAGRDYLAANQKRNR